jgi:23S rRNA pseudouridine1911/1915/1917 synthase
MAHPPREREDSGPPGGGEASGGEEVARAGEYILPGGKVDAEAIARALEAARTSGEASDDAELRRVTFEIRRDLKKRLDRYLTDRIGFMSRNQLQRLIDEGGVLVNDRMPKSSTVLRAGDVVEVVIPEPPGAGVPPEDIPLDVLYEDECLIVLNKPPDIIVHPARSHLKGTMINALAFHFQKRSPLGGELSSVGTEFARPGVVHRLDRHTSGVIVFAKQDEAHWKLGHQFEHRRVNKRYLAVTHGRIEPPGDAIDLPLGPHPSREKGYREKYVVRHDELGKPALTIARVREWYRVGDRDYTLVELELRTGRTHQIRVHLSHLGWPIVGDDMYTGKAVGLRADGERETLVQFPGGGEPPPPGVRPLIVRQALHACTLGFTHPIRETPMEFTAPLRGDMALLVRTLRELSGGGERPTVPGATVDLDRAVPPGA